jgi:2-succinyl-6-hydroxy-2,4-cyclohexadiene-1-carboxylate synthase
MTRFSVNDVHLNVEVTGTGPAILLLHGFTGSSITWASLLDVCQEYTTIVVDLLGHGHSDCPSAPDRYRMEHCVEDLFTLLDHLDIQRIAVLGYSMGGRVALHLALRAPERLWALVLESASPGIADATERECRRRSDAALAKAIERDGIAAFVDRWQALPLFATQTQLPAAVQEELRCQRLNNNPRGLANSLRGLGAGMQEPVLQSLGQIQVPTLLLAGALDGKYCKLARQMAAVLPDRQFVIVPQCGHTVHLEQPAAFAETIRQFLTHCWQNQLKKEKRQ